MERGSSVVECQTHNQGNPGSNLLCYRFEDCASKSVKPFERSNGLATVLYKNYLYLYMCTSLRMCARACLSVYVCIFVCTCSCACVRECVCMHGCARGNVCLCSCVCVCVCMCECGRAVVRECLSARARACVSMHVALASIIAYKSLQTSSIH